MAYPKNPIGTCPACDLENVPLCKNKYLGEERVCKKCSDAATKAGNSEKKKQLIPPATSPTSKPCKAPAVAAKKPVQVSVPTAVDTGHSAGCAIILSITCHEHADVVRVLLATQGMSVAVGLEGLV